MQNLQQLADDIQTGAYSQAFSYLYCQKSDAAPSRYQQALQSFRKLFGDGPDIRLFSAPGRTEVGGNHTDHQHGRVLAAGVDLDVIAVAKKNDDNIIRIQSKGYPMDVIDLSVLTPQNKEIEHAPALIRGVAARFAQLGYTVGGFDAYTTSDVLKGSGLSSSAAFEVLVCTMLNHLYNDGRMDPVTAAMVSQYAENVFFKKPCGLMDQMACSVGGFVAIDFQDPAQPVIEKVDFDFAQVQHRLCIVDTGGSHSDLTGEYAAVPAEMKQVAALFGKQVLREVDEDAFYERLGTLRGQVSDRALLRAIHFFNDNRRAATLKEQLKQKDFNGFLQTVKESGRSSLSCLQNVYASSAPEEQGLTLALALSARVLGDRGGYRVHGGGFAGTIQAFVPEDLLPAYQQQMEAVFGAGSCHVLNIRPVGGVQVTPQLGAEN